VGEAGEMVEKASKRKSKFDHEETPEARGEGEENRRRNDNSMS